MKNIHKIYFIIAPMAMYSISCNFLQLKNSSEGCTEPIYSYVPYDQDSLIMSPDTKYFYRYKTEVVEWNYEPDWILTTLYCLHNIKVTEAWYLTKFANNHQGTTQSIPNSYPGFIVGMTNDTTDIWRYHFALDTLFDPIKAYRNNVNHFVFKGFRNVAPNQVLKLTE